MVHNHTRNRNNQVNGEKQEEEKVTKGDLAIIG